jgi:hypothetical protein
MTYQQYANALCIKLRDTHLQLRIEPQSLYLSGYYDALKEAIELFKDATDVVDWDEAQREETNYVKEN